MYAPLIVIFCIFFRQTCGRLMHINNNKKNHTALSHEAINNKWGVSFSVFVCTNIN